MRFFRREGWGAIYQRSEYLVFRSTANTLKLWLAGRERIYFEYFWNVFAADKTRSILKWTGKPMPTLTRAPDYARRGVFRFMARTRERFCAWSNQTDDGIVDRRGQIVSKQFAAMKFWFLSDLTVIVLEDTGHY